MNNCAYRFYNLHKNDHSLEKYNTKFRHWERENINRLTSLKWLGQQLPLKGKGKRLLNSLLNSMKYLKNWHKF